MNFDPLSFPSFHSSEPVVVSDCEDHTYSMGDQPVDMEMMLL